MLHDALYELVTSSTPAAELGALESAAKERGPALLAAFTAVGRRVGKAQLAAASRELDGRGADELVRTWLLVTAARSRSGAEMLQLIRDAWAHGDNRERHAVLRALPLLPGPEQYLPLAIDACRTSVQTIFEAIACENPYPAAHFPELNFNQLVLKAVFTGAALARIAGLELRKNPELARMARGYASERRAAGRTVPSDLDLIT